MGLLWHSDIQLTVEDINEIRGKLAAVSSYPKCPMCKTNNLVVNRLINVSTPKIEVVCGQCGLILTFVAEAGLSETQFIKLLRLS